MLVPLSEKGKGKKKIKLKNIAPYPISQSVTFILLRVINSKATGKY